jgi:histidinol-phosphate aminotransferase
MGLDYADRISRIPVYPAADGYALDESVALLASNEAPFAPVIEAAQAAARAASTAHRYPDPTSSRLRETLSGVTSIPAERIAVGNGSCDILLALGEALLQPGREVVYAWPSFSIYPHLAATTGAEAVAVGLDSEDRHDLDALAAAVTERTALLIVCNPNNPTSTAVGLDQISAFLDRVPERVCVVLDEAYREFVEGEDPDATIGLLSSHPNLVILRTFSKVHGLAALRVGYGLCGDAETRTAVDQVRQPFFCNSAAQAAAVEALHHPDEIERRVAHVRSERSFLSDGLVELGIAVADSQANFLWCRLPDGVEEASVVRGLAQRDVLVRAGTALGATGYLRITVGLREEHERLLAALTELL